MADVNYYFGPWQMRADGPMAGWHAPEGTVGLIDFGSLPDCEQADGTLRPRGLFCVPRAQQLPAEEYDLIDSGDCREIVVTEAHTTRLKGICNVDLSQFHGVTLAQLWHEMLMAGDPTGAGAWKPNVPTHRGVWEVHLGGHSQIFGRRYSPRAAGASQVLDVVLHDFSQLLIDVANEREAIKQERSQVAKDKDKGSKEEKEKRAKRDEWLAKHDAKLAELPGKVLRANADKYRIDPMQISKDVEPRRPTTTISDDFTRADGTGIGNQLTWTAVSGTWETVSNRARLATASDGSIRVARAESDLSSSDHYAQEVMYGINDWYAQHGQAVRLSASENTCYVHQQSRWEGYYSIWCKHVTGTRTVLANGNDGGLPNADGDTGKGEVSGGNLTGYRNGSTCETVVDTAISSGTRTGIWQYRWGAGYDPRADNFEAADLLAPGRVPLRYRRGSRTRLRM